MDPAVEAVVGSVEEGAAAEEAKVVVVAAIGLVVVRIRTLEVEHWAERCRVEQTEEKKKTGGVSEWVMKMHVWGLFCFT
jgi:hypothetical protein